MKNRLFAICLTIGITAAIGFIPELRAAPKELKVVGQPMAIGMIQKKRTCLLPKPCPEYRPGYYGYLYPSRRDRDQIL